MTTTRTVPPGDSQFTVIRTIPANTEVAEQFYVQCDHIKKVSWKDQIIVDDYSRLGGLRRNLGARKRL